MEEKEKCFALRKDGQCHCLKHKICKYCSFYKPRSEVKDNPFYEFSYINEWKMKDMIRKYHIDKATILKVEDMG